MRVRYSYDAFRMQRHGGVSRYASELHRGLVQQGIDSRVLAPLHRNEYLADTPGVMGVDIDRLRPVPVRQVLTKTTGRLFERLWAPGQDRGTVYHKTYFDLSVPRGPTLAVTVYDMIHEVYPDGVGNRDVTPQAKRAWCERADVVFTISSQTRDDLLERFSIDPERIVVTPLGVRPVSPSPALIARGSRPFLLYVGARSPAYKNFERFVRAFAQSSAARDLRLRCFGGGPLTPDERQLINDVGIETEMMSGSDADLAASYRLARALVYPSLYEGFGLPPLEAMSHGCPVAASRAGAIPEVVGPAAELFDPENENELAEAIDRVALDEDRRTVLDVAGTKRVEEYTWERTVDLTLAGYKRVLG